MPNDFTLSAPVELPRTIARRALECLNLELSTSQENELFHYMEKVFRNCSCVVLCMKTSAGSILESLGIDIGTQEVVINESFHIFYSHSFMIKPHEVARA